MAGLIPVSWDVVRLGWSTLGGCTLALIAACGFQVSAGDEDPTVFTGEWWDPAYAYRRAIVVKTEAALGEGYAVSFTTDTAALVTSGEVLADGRDWRIVRRDDDQWREVDRWVDDVDGGGWNTATTRTWFRLPVALAAGTTDARTYIYHGGTAVADEPLAELDRVFLVGDDFERGLDRWTTNGRGEVVTIGTNTKAGTAALQILTDGTEAAGLHRDVVLPAIPLLFSTYLRQDQTGASFGYARGFLAPYADRLPSPRWNDGQLRLFCELDSGDRLQVIADATIENWHDPFGAATWRRVETVIDTVGDTVTVRVDGGPWFGPFPNRYQQHTAIESIALEGEGGQPGTFAFDNYTIRAFVDPEPIATTQPREQR